MDTYKLLATLQRSLRGQHVLKKSFFYYTNEIKAIIELAAFPPGAKHLQKMHFLVNKWNKSYYWGCSVPSGGKTSSKNSLFIENMPKRIQISETYVKYREHSWNPAKNMPRHIQISEKYVKFWTGVGDHFARCSGCRAKMRAKMIILNWG